jgi:hypothetical protein
MPKSSNYDTKDINCGAWYVIPQSIWATAGE